MKKGVTLMALALTMAIMLVILGVVVPTGFQATTRAKLATFAMDMRTIEDAVALEVNSDNEAIFMSEDVNKNKVLRSLDSNSKQQLKQEFNANGDSKTEEFEIVKVDKLDIENNKYGVSKKLPDAVIYSDETGKVYYAEGEKIGGKKYFSLTNNLENETENTVRKFSLRKSNYEKIDFSKKMYVEKLTRAFTNNEIKIKIVTEKINNAKVFLNISDKEIDITDKIVNDIYTFKLNEDITEEDLNNNKEIEIVKKVNGKATDLKRVNIENLDIKAPTIETFTKTKGDNGYSIKFESKDNKGIDKVKYKVFVEKVGTEKIPQDKNKQREFIFAKGQEVTGNIINVQNDWIKYGIVPVDAAGNVGKAFVQNIFDTVNKPEMIKSKDNTYYPVAYDKNKGIWKVVSYNNAQNEWYDYNENAKKWANIISVDKKTSYKIGDVVSENLIKDWYVWLPRFAYSINSYKNEVADAEGVTTEIFDITFLVNNSDMDIKGNEYPKDYNEDLVKIGEKTPKIVHPAFSFAGNEVKGIWVSKFNNTEDKFNQTENRKETGYNIYQTYNQFSKNIDKTVNYNRHSIKNTEWGALVYMTASKYGYIPKMHKMRTTTFKDGYYKKHIELSNTGNVYGVYELNGGLSEIVMANFEWAKDRYNNELGRVLSSGSEKYFDKYSVGNQDLTNEEKVKNAINLFKSKKGDAMYEVMAENQFEIAKDLEANYVKPEGVDKETTLYNGDAARFSTYTPFIKRGGSYEDYEKSGIFAISPFEYSTLPEYNGKNRDKNGGRRYILVEGKYN